MLKILGKTPSINVRKVLWMCAEMDLPYEHEQWGSGYRSTQDPAFLALNPNATVPVIVDDGFVLWESNSICRYLAESRHRSDLLPTAPRQRAQVEQWMDWQASELNIAWRYAFMSLVRQSPEHRDGDAVRASVGSWNRLMQLLDRQLASTGAYVTGGEFTVADVLLGLSAHRWRASPIVRAELPAVDAYLERLKARKGFQLYCTSELP